MIYGIRSSGGPATASSWQVPAERANVRQARSLCLEIANRARTAMTKVHSDSTPPKGWPQNVRIISLEGLGRIGIDPKTNELYWDGQRIVTEKRLASYERWLATLATGSAVVVAVVEMLRAGGVVY